MTFFGQCLRESGFARKRVVDGVSFRTVVADLEERPSKGSPGDDKTEHSRRAWLLPLAAICGLSLTTQGASYLLIQLYLKDLGVQPLIISLSSSLGWMGTLLGSVFWGSLSDTRAKRPLFYLILGGGSLVIGSLAFSLPAAGVLAVSFVRVFLVTGVTAIALAVVSGMSTLQQRGRNLSYINSFRSLGFLAGSLGAGFLLEELGFRFGFAVLAVLPLLALSFVSSLSEGKSDLSKRRDSTFRILTKGGLRCLYIGTVLRQMGTAGAGSLIYVHMASLGIRAGAMGGVSALNPAIQVLGMLLFGQLADRIGRKAIFLFGFGASALVPLVYALSKSVWGMASGYLLLGVAFSSLYVGSTAHIGDRIPANQQGAMLGLFESSRGLGGVLGPLLAGAITPYVGYQGMFLTMVGVAAIGFLFVLLGGPRSTELIPSTTQR